MSAFIQAARAQELALGVAVARLVGDPLGLVGDRVARVGQIRQVQQEVAQTTFL